MAKIDEVNDILPGDITIDEKLDADALNRVLRKVSEEYPKQFSKVANELRRIGVNHIYEQGFSVGLDDLEILENRDEIVENAKDDLDQVDDDDFDTVAQIGGKYGDQIESDLDDQLRGSNNNFFRMVDAGARGSMNQLRQMMASPLMLKNPQNEPVPMVIDKSYAEGLELPDYWTGLYGARKGVIDRRLSQAKPGEISKELIKTVNDQTITTEDCGTDQGVEKNIENKSINGRVLAEPAGDVAGAGKVINPNLAQDLKQSGVENVKVRSPLTCEAKHGICQKCYGYDEFGEFPDVGDNVGVKSGQALGEPISQMTMNTFHSGGVVQGPESQDVISGLPRIDQLLSMPNSISDEAAISEETGKVKNVEESDSGGLYVDVLNEEEDRESRHFVEPKQELLVEEGEEVKRADKLSTGVPDPSKMVDLVGINETRKKLTNELKSAYQGFGIDDGIFETVVRGVTDLVRIKDPGDSDEYVPGDYASFSDVHAKNQEETISKPVSDAVGDPAARDYNSRYAMVREGEELSEEQAKRFRDEGVEEIEVAKNPIKFRPEMRGINSINNYRPDWMTRIGFNRIQQALEEGVAQGHESEIHGYDPIPSFAYGAEFGEQKVPGGY